MCTSDRQYKEAFDTWFDIVVVDKTWIEQRQAKYSKLITTDSSILLPHYGIPHLNKTAERNKFSAVPHLLCETTFPKRDHDYQLQVQVSLLADEAKEAHTNSEPYHNLKPSRK